MANPVAPVANMGAGQVASSIHPDVLAWMHNNPARAQEAKSRDDTIKAFFGLENYDLYEQGSSLVIAARMALPPAGAAAIPRAT